MNADARTPGQLITELLKEQGWTNRVLALVLGVSEPIVSKMASDKRPIDAAMALALEEVFEVPAQRFIDLQSSYELAKARIRSGRTQSARCARRYMVTFLWLR